MPSFRPACALAGVATLLVAASASAQDPADPTEADVLPVIHVYAGTAAELPFHRNDPVNPAVGLTLGASAEAWHKEDGYWGLWLSPEIGYSARILETGDYHAGVVGFGVGVGNRWAWASLTPRVYLGGVEDRSVERFGVMLSHGITGHFLLEIVRLDVAHEMLLTGDGIRNFFTATGSLDLVVAGMAFAKL